MELKAYLGLLTYYGRFIKGLSTVLEPLHQLLRKDSKWRWTKTEEKSFQKSKELLLSMQVLVHFDPKHPLVLSCDASKYGIKAVLSHIIEDGAKIQWHLHRVP